MLTDKHLVESFEQAASIILKSYQKNRRLLIIGNGGSAADAQHLAAEFVSKLEFDRMPLPALALTVDTSMITAIGNDYGFEDIFARQLEANGVEGDTLLAISTSGRSANVLKCAKKAKEMGIKVVGLTGKALSPLDEHCDIVIKVPSTAVAVIQECHILIEHSLCEFIEQKLLG